jgi:hypothetical protein
VRARGVPPCRRNATTGVFKKKPEHETDYGADPEWLALMAPELRAELIDLVKNGKESEIDQKIYDITCGLPLGESEVDKG